MLIESGLVKAVFLMIMATIALIDWHKHEIYNVMVIPAIVIGVGMTGNLHWAMGALIIMASFYHDAELNPRGVLKMGGGDVKLFSMIGAFLGILVIPITVFTFLLIKVYRSIKHQFYEPLPVAPFALVVSFLFICN